MKKLTDEQIEFLILSKFHGFTIEQWNVLKHEFPYSELIPLVKMIANFYEPQSGWVDVKDEPKDIDFIEWYSGMNKGQIISAYKRYLNEGELPAPPEKEKP